MTYKNILLFKNVSVSYTKQTVPAPAKSPIRKCLFYLTNFLYCISLLYSIYLSNLYVNVYNFYRQISNTLRLHYSYIIYKTVCLLTKNVNTLKTWLRMLLYLIKENSGKGNNA